MAELLSANALEQLKLVTVDIGTPTTDRGTFWNPGEGAYIMVTVTNTTGVPLRDVVVRLFVGGAASIYPYYFIDGTWYWAEIEPGETKDFYAILVADRAGNVHTSAAISAEVVPYVTNWHMTHRSDLIFPSGFPRVPVAPPGIDT